MLKVYKAREAKVNIRLEQGDGAPATPVTPRPLPEKAFRRRKAGQ
ncbi:MAG TPA: hypothetical protein VN379_09135 [Sporomusa sp.]|nr:hypothetical protein [Sporomusa sp.]